MRNTFSKRIFAVLAAVLLGAALCAPLTFADEADTADTTDSTETVDTTEGTTDTAGEDSSGAESFFNELKADNGVGRTLFIAGAVCIVLGVGGIVSIILWQRASRNRDSGEADRAESCKARRTCAEARAAAPGKYPEAGCTDSAGKACCAESARKI